MPSLVSQIFDLQGGVCKPEIRSKGVGKKVLLRLDNPYELNLSKNTQDKIIKYFSLDLRPRRIRMAQSHYFKECEETYFPLRGDS